MNQANTKNKKMFDCLSARLNINLEVGVSFTVSLHFTSSYFESVIQIITKAIRERGIRHKGALVEP